jgi:hypothetical protein
VEEEVYMTKKAMSRADVFIKISQWKITKTTAAKILGITFRHLHRLYKEYQARGLVALGSKQRGKPSNRQLPTITKARVLELVTLEKYHGFGPTFMCEQLKKLHSITISSETTRRLMIQAGVWQADEKKRPVIHQQRKRRACYGELIQIDGSPHSWFENRGESCVLIVFIDDATGRAYGKFFESETTEAYMIVAQEYIKKNGRPKAFYSDRYSVFRINKPGCLKKELVTQFGRACKELDIELICANSPQAKGRVERAMQTLQDRLVKEMRLRNISNIDSGNQFLAEFWEEFNRKFSVNPESKENAHRELTSQHILEKIFCFKHQRKVSKNLEISYNNVIYQISEERKFNTIVGAKVTVLELITGDIFLEYKGKLLSFKKYSEQEYSGQIIPSREMNELAKKSKSTPKPVVYNHPWKQEGRAEKRRRAYQNI